MRLSLEILTRIQRPLKTSRRATQGQNIKFDYSPITFTRRMYVRTKFRKIFVIYDYHSRLTVPSPVWHNNRAQLHRIVWQCSDDRFDSSKEFHFERLLYSTVPNVYDLKLLTRSVDGKLHRLNFWHLKTIPRRKMC